MTTIKAGICRLACHLLMETYHGAHLGVKVEMGNNLTPQIDMVKSSASTLKNYMLYRTLKKKNIHVFI